MTRFFLKEQYDALLKCDGKIDIDPVQLDETTRNWYRHWEENGMIARIRGKRQRKIQYNNFRKRYKNVRSIEYNQRPDPDL